MSLMEPVAPWLRDLNRFFTTQGGAVAAPFMPAADVIVSDESVRIEMDVPGLRAENLEIELENDLLTVRGERPFPYAGQEYERTWRHIERAFGRFERSIRVPRGLDPDSVEAGLTDGVLSVRIPKPVSPQPHRVQIKGGGEETRQVGPGEARQAESAEAGQMEGAAASQTDSGEARQTEGAAS
ncbi:MAG: heat shock protein Hsp20 [Solirubrobacterales bacterium]|nr:heat shock protein Hsp20 [Solirubrobacterales bacterium]